MSLALPTLLSLTRRDDRNAAPDATPDAPALHARLADALLGDALLDLDDLGPGWDACDSGAAAPFAHTPYAGIVIANLRRSFVRASDDARLEQEIAVLPRWTLRHLSDDFTEYPSDALEAVLPASFVQTATGARAGSMVAPAAAPRRTGIVRRGAVVMALRFVSRTGTDAPAAIVAIAEQKCTEIAEVLR